MKLFRALSNYYPITGPFEVDRCQTTGMLLRFDSYQQRLTLYTTAAINR